MGARLNPSLLTVSLSFLQDTNAALASPNDSDANVSLEIRACCGAFLKVRRSFDVATGVSITTPLCS